MTPFISIIILVKNHIEYLPRLFTSLEKQKLPESFEVIIVDSGSTDGSLAFFKKQLKKQKKFKVRLFEINPSEFAHGRTRNFAASKAQGKILVFLTADALPLRSNWLRILTEPLKTEDFVATFCRLTPYPSAPIYDRYFDHVVYPLKDRIISGVNRREIILTDYMYYSNVCGAIKKSVFRKIPFNEDKIMSEDQWWGKKVVNKGYAIKYLSSTTVMHSHVYTLNRFFNRQFTSGYSLIGIKKNLLLRLILVGIPYLAGESFFLLSRSRMGDFFYMFIYEGLRFFGFICGVWGDKIPVNLRNLFFYYSPLKK